MKSTLLAIVALALVAHTLKRYRDRQRARDSPETVIVKLDKQEENEHEVFTRAKRGLDYFQTHAKLGSVVGRDEIKIQYAVLTPATQVEATRTVFFLTGWSESMEKYGDLFQDMVEKHGFRVVAMDHRSHGKSGRLPMSEAAFNHFKSHVMDFHDHVTDALLVLNATVNLQSDNLFIMGFSLGGLIAMELNKIVPSKGLVLVAPCLHVSAMPMLPRPIFRMVAILARFALGHDAYVVGHPLNFTLEEPLPPQSSVTSSTARVRYWNLVHELMPHTCIHGMSWSHLLCLLTPEVDTHPLLTNQVLVLSAAKEKLVDNQTIFDFCANRRANANMYCRHVHYEDGLHDLLCEQEYIRDNVLQEITKFMLYSKL